MEDLSVDRRGDEIAELSAHVEAATARLLDLIREFDARAGWNTGFDFILPAELPRDPVSILRARTHANGLHVDARTLTPTWLGEPLNVGYAIDVMHPLAR
jgi:hypothetical protein